MTFKIFVQKYRSQLKDLSISDNWSYHFFLNAKKMIWGMIRKKLNWSICNRVLEDDF